MKRDETPVLAGRTVLVTRARHQAAQLSEKLRALGALVVEIPAIGIVAPESFADLDSALGNLSQYGWLIVTSANGVAALAGRMQVLGIVADAFAGLKIAAVGSATARALEDWGLTVTVTPAEYVAESLVEALEDRVRGQRVWLAGAAVARRPRAAEPPARRLPGWPSAGRRRARRSARRASDPA